MTAPKFSEIELSIIENMMLTHSYRDIAKAIDCGSDIGAVGEMVEQLCGKKGVPSYHSSMFAWKLKDQKVIKTPKVRKIKSEVKHISKKDLEKSDRRRLQELERKKQNRIEEERRRKNEERNRPLYETKKVKIAKRLKRR